MSTVFVSKEEMDAIRRNPAAEVSEGGSGAEYVRVPEYVVNLKAKAKPVEGGIYAWSKPLILPHFDANKPPYDE